MTDYFNECKELLERGQIQEAIAVLQQATTVDLSSAWGVLMVGEKNWLGVIKLYKI